MLVCVCVAELKALAIAVYHLMIFYRNYVKF